MTTDRQPDTVNSNVNSNKVNLRRSLLNTRKSMPPEVWRDNSDRLCDRLQQVPLFTQATTILSFLSFRQEPDLSPLYTLPKRWGFPRCVETSLVWHQGSPSSPMEFQTGAYGIREPHPDLPLIDPDAVDLILVPAIACDLRGYRLGYGGGFYDRMLSQPAWSAKLALGIVFDFARVPLLPNDPWDCPLHGICTEAGFFWSKHS
ncbi:MAG: 5-formyltetrahydrofolate cyclo-ligase [Elainellaceae cyanobacterium]